jgi:CRISPR-associated endoribonuclease Cas6
MVMALQLRFREYHVPLTVADGEYAHAAILHAISDMDAEAGQKLHGMHRHKQLTIAIVDSDTLGAVLRVTFMAEEGIAYANLLAGALAKQPVLRIGKATCDIGSVDTAHPVWSGISTWADLASGTSARYLDFRFVTPTAITKTDGNGGRFISPLPSPLDVFSGLARRWQALEGPKLPDDLTDFIHAGGCVIASMKKLNTLTFHTPRRSQIGFTGEVLYECHKNDPTYVSALNSLARLAFFTGVGYQTARGMGAVRTANLN